jgi:hypothetical protein
VFAAIPRDARETGKRLQYAMGGRREEMNQKDSLSKLYCGSCFFVLFFIAAAASFNGYYDKWGLLDTNENGSTHGRNNFESMVDGTAERPWVYRQLLPMLANWIDRQVSEQTKDWLFTAQSHRGSGWRGSHFLCSPVAASRAYFLRYWIVYAAVFMSAWISVFVMYLVCKSVGYAHATAAASAIIMILLMPYFLTHGGYLYDYPELMFLALAVWLALNFDWWWMIPMVALATWNKESFLLFIPALYPLLRRRRSRIDASIGTGVLGLICAAVYYVLRLRFQQNPGGTVIPHLTAQIQCLLHPSYFFRLEMTYGVIAVGTYNPLPVALIGWTIWRGWRYLPRTIQCYSKIAAIINIPLYILFCSPGELRDLSFLYITFLLLVAANVEGMIDGQTEAASHLSA